MARLFSAEGNVSGYTSHGPEVNSNAGSPHAASIGAGAAPVGGQQPAVGPLNTGGKSFLQRAQMKNAEPPGGPGEEQNPGSQPGQLPPGSPPAAAPPPGSAGGMHAAPAAGTNAAYGGTSGAGNAGWSWTAKVVNRVPSGPSYGGAAYNGGGGSYAQAMSNPNAPRAAISSGKVIQGQIEPPDEP